MARDALITGGDIVRTEDGDFAFVDGLDELAQSTAIELATIRGTHVDDDSFGVPFLEIAFQKAPDLALFGAVIRATLEARPDILGVIRFLPGFDATTRKYTLTWKAETTQGLLDATT